MKDWCPFCFEDIEDDDRVSIDGRDGTVQHLECRKAHDEEYGIIE